MRRVRATCCPAQRLRVTPRNGAAEPHRRPPQAGRHLSAAAAVHLPLGGVAALQGQGWIPLDLPRRVARPKVSENQPRPLNRQFFCVAVCLLAIFARRTHDNDLPAWHWAASQETHHLTLNARADTKTHFLG